MKKLLIIIGLVVSLGVVSQVVERTINEDAVRATVQTHLKETSDEGDEEFIDFEENTVMEYLGF